MRTSLHSTLRSLTLPLTLACCSGTVLSTAAVPAAGADFGFSGHARGQENRATPAGNQLGRWLGIGWGDGYHACQPRRAGHLADAPPATYYDSPAHHGPVHHGPVHHGPAQDGPRFIDPEYVRLPWLAAAKGLPVPPAAPPASPSVAGQPASSPFWGPLQR
ncbi:hypothetical protein [Candidatus Laterigemmans baculatus]|uniref:hypothetical protein n=1 Tax=Candidatus Laterigemmans baculatus TaxID=2770505 RepID=UPI0013DAF5B9|nr:hypothetical protein [Candidatus Laterigemmans baculatus]